MSFREKRAWVELISILAVYSVYAALYGRTWFDVNASGIGAPTVSTVVILTLVLILVQVFLLIAAATASPGEVRGPYDERDRMIALSASRAGFVALQIGAFIVLVDVWLGAGPALIANSALLTMAVGQAVRAAWQVVGYRRTAA